MSPKTIRCRRNAAGSMASMFHSDAGSTAGGRGQESGDKNTARLEGGMEAAVEIRDARLVGLVIQTA